VRQLRRQRLLQLLLPLRALLQAAGQASSRAARARTRRPETRARVARLGPSNQFGRPSHTPPLPHSTLRSTNPNYPVFYYGVVGTGLLPAVQQYVLLVQAAIDNRQAELGATAGGTLQPLRVIDPAVGIPGTLSAMDLDAIDQLCDAYLPAGLGALSSAVKVQGVRVVASFAGTDVIVVSLSFVALVVLYVGYYMPTILALDAQLKRTRFLLLLCEFLRRVRAACARRSHRTHASNARAARSPLTSARTIRAHRTVPEELARSVPAVVNAGRKLIEGAM
jgi:hypothetical protein